MLSRSLVQESIPSSEVTATSQCQTLDITHEYEVFVSYPGDFVRDCVRVREIRVKCYDNTQVVLSYK